MSASHRALGGATILLVEDDDATAADLQTSLIGAGYIVPRASSADEALLTLDSAPADLVITSLMLPDTDGLILCATVKTRFAAPIIVLTKRAGEVDRALALESGATDCLTVPVDRDELLAQVNAVLQSRVPAAISHQFQAADG
jgi:DNA-binding response OmpR family regulator